MNVTYDKDFAPVIWDMVKDIVKDHKCPFCDKKLTVKTFSGADWINDEPRLLHKDITCIIAYADVIKEREVNESLIS